MRRLQLKNRKEYAAWLTSGKRPKFIPAAPEKEYKHTGWIDLADWLGHQRKPEEENHKNKSSQSTLRHRFST